MPHFRLKGYGCAVEVVALSSALGAEIVGVDLTQPLPADTQVQLRQLFVQYHLLAVRGQKLTAADHDRFVGCFGPLQAQRAGDGAGYVTSRTDDPRSLFSELRPLLWHNDGAYGPRPGIATSLWAEEVAPTAAPTLFANVNDIVERLPPALLERAERLHVLNVRDTEFDRTYERVPLAEIRASEDPSRYVTYEHPVLFHPPHIAGRTVIASENMTSGVVDAPAEEGEAFLAELYAHIYAPQNTYTHVWRPGDVVIWDNIALHHARPGEVGHEPRHLRRQCIDGWYTPDGALLDWTFTRQKVRAK